MDALLQLENLLSDDECGCSQQASEYREELKTMHHRYEHLLDELAEQVTEYEALYHHVKVQFLGRKLKALKKEISVEQPEFISLQENIRMAYGA